MSKLSRPQQLPLHLPQEAARARDDLIVTSSNQRAVSYLDRWPSWPNPVTILTGPAGSGKSHLAHIWATHANAAFLHTSPDGSGVVPQSGNFVVEDIAQAKFGENWLFHLINASRASGSSLLLTSRRWPADWGVVLADLASRIKLAHTINLHEPDDDLLRGVLVKLFSDRQLQVDKSLIDYLVSRMERSLASAQVLVEEIDQLSLSQMRPVTKPLAAQALRHAGLQE